MRSSIIGVRHRFSGFVGCFGTLRYSRVVASLEVIEINYENKQPKWRRLAPPLIFPSPCSLMLPYKFNSIDGVASAADDMAEPTGLEPIISIVTHPSGF